MSNPSVVYFYRTAPVFFAATGTIAAYVVPTILSLSAPEAIVLAECYFMAISYGTARATRTFFKYRVDGKVWQAIVAVTVALAIAVAGLFTSTWPISWLTSGVINMWYGYLFYPDIAVHTEKLILESSSFLPFTMTALLLSLCVIAWIFALNTTGRRHRAVIICGIIILSCPAALITASNMRLYAAMMHLDTEGLESVAAMVPVEEISVEDANSRFRSEVARVPWLGLIRHGSYVSEYFRGRTHVRTSYLFNRRHGPFKMYFPSGSKYIEGSFDLGRRVGSWTVWLENGDKIAEGEFVGGDPLNPWRYFIPEEPTGFLAPYDEKVVFHQLQ